MKVNTYKLELRLFTVLLVFLTSFSCFGQTSFPITSEIISDYYTTDCNDSSLFYIHPLAQLNTVNFNEQEASVPIQGEYFTKNTVSTKLRYYEALSFKKGNYDYKVVIYNSLDAPNDGLALKIQLNSYNAEGILLDAVMLDSRYSDEEAKLWKDFIIEENGTILIDENIVRSIYIDDAGNEHEATSYQVETYAKAEYVIDHGFFKLIKRDELIKIN